MDVFNVGLGVFALQFLIGAIIFGGLSWVYIQRAGLFKKPKNDPISKAMLEGDLAFRNALGEDANPYIDNESQLSDAWMRGFQGAAEMVKNRKIPECKKI